MSRLMTLVLAVSLAGCSGSVAANGQPSPKLLFGVPTTSIDAGEGPAFQGLCPATWCTSLSLA